MQKLTKAEEEIMRFIWQLERGTVSQMLHLMPKPAPPQSTVSSFVRLLEKKGFVGHEAYGKTHVYFPIISKEKYGHRSLGDLMRDYFDGSASRLVSHLMTDEKISEKDRAELLEKLQNIENQ
jgi:BlaI family transcriptional regulator, penicillinase repressor